MKSFVALLLILGAASADISAVVDSIIQVTRSHMKSKLDFPPLDYKDLSWDPGFTKYDVTAELETSTGKVVLGKFAREQTPVLYGSSKDGVLETRFFIKDSTVTYNRFSALNHTSGDKSEGELTATFGDIEMYSLIKMKSRGHTCTTSVSTIIPIAIGDATAKFNPESKLTQDLWVHAQSTLNYSLNSTIVRIGWPEFAKVVATTDLCSLLS